MRYNAGQKSSAWWVGGGLRDLSRGVAVCSAAFEVKSFCSLCRCSAVLGVFYAHIFSRNFTAPTVLVCN